MWNTGICSSRGDHQDSQIGYDGAESNIWSCGVVLFALVAGYISTPNLIENVPEAANAIPPRNTKILVLPFFPFPSLPET
jgi:hypothetical protein